MFIVQETSIFCLNKSLLSIHQSKIEERTKKKQVACTNGNMHKGIQFLFFFLIGLIINGIMKMPRKKSSRVMSSENFCNAH